MVEIVLIYGLIINIIGMYVMYDDKQRAKRRAYRISEKTLWIISIIGGAVGATIGMHRFRHKTQHLAFRIGFPLLSIIDIVILFFILFH
ncbi:DUF1294 domain-containing protein [Alicyclobacillus sp. SO9]|uniref:DUF1294 domain-containing protein n=1 Tax=Alicyclobacillus sp. SO9 TaxID=2665646 RepID=UPI0018E6DD92|nr:DUF1294 domain-containing protein [Alicyclobacillus sp. SO9]QQE77607.1 DUF1294 domain-containing protein [Alicyclobacillus sp. SO9]